MVGSSASRRWPRTWRHHRAGALRIAVLPALAQWLVPDALAQFMQDRPQVRTFAQSLPSRQIAELVSTRQFDAGVIELPLSHAGIEVRALPLGAAGGRYSARASPSGLHGARCMGWPPSA